MLFVKTHEYDFSIPKDYLIHSLTGTVIKLNDQEFNFVDHGSSLAVIAFDQDIDSLKTFPITKIDLYGDGNKTKAVITSIMSKADAGGPIVMLMLCLFLFLGAFLLLYVSKDMVLTISICILSMCIFIVFLIYMYIYYFYYIRKINTHIKFICDHITSDMRRQLMKHKLM